VVVLDNFINVEEEGDERNVRKRAIKKSGGGAKP